ncbi:hypothetical protein Tco_0705441 [Tanacetum coccineum]|uniref:Uncharacterized protein n=1 Tax=Tanacetum coccineum TaxID=301880 RepID=A0ABQ4Y4L6_9ASTR
MNHSPLGELRAASNSTNLPMMWTVMMDREVERDYGIARRLLEVATEVHTSLSTRQEIIKEAKHHKDPRMVRSVAFFREQQAQDMKLLDDIMLKIFKTQLRTFKKEEFGQNAKNF